MTVAGESVICCIGTRKLPSEKGGVVTIAELKSMFVSLWKTNPRKAAEVAFVLACRYHEGGDVENAGEFARTCLSIFDALNAQGELSTMEDCATRFGELGGVAIPELIHEGIAENRFRLWGVKL